MPFYLSLKQDTLLTVFQTLDVKYFNTNFETIQNMVFVLVHLQTVKLKLLVPNLNSCLTYFQSYVFYVKKNFGFILVLYFPFIFTIKTRPGSLSVT